MIRLTNYQYVNCGLTFFYIEVFSQKKTGYDYTRRIQIYLGCCAWYEKDKKFCPKCGSDEHDEADHDRGM